MNFFANIKRKIIELLKWLTNLSFVKKFKLIIYILLSVLVIVLLFFIVRAFILKFIKKDDLQDKPTIKVKVKRIKKVDLSEKYSVMGTIKGTTENDLRFEIEGILLKFNYKEGDKISKGEVIAYLDTKDALTKLSYAKSKYESEKSAYFSAKQRLKVYEDLYQLKAISESKLIETRYEVESVKQKMETSLAELELAQSNLLKTNLYAPMYGILAEIIIHPGEFVTPQDVVARFVSIGDTNFEVDVPEKDTNKLKIGMKVKVFPDSYPNKEFNGMISEIAPTVNPKTRTVLIRVKIPNEEGLLKSGMFARGEILISELSNIIVVPQESVVSLGQETKLLPLVVSLTGKKNQGIVELRQVIVGKEIDKNIEIKDGVQEGELYIVGTNEKYSDGILVEYIDEDAKEE